MKLTQPFRFRRLRSKLQAIFTFAAVISLTLILILMSLLQLHLISSEWENSLQAQARVIAFNSEAAVAFSDAREAERLLHAIDTHPDIIAARLFNELSGEEFAHYQAPRAMPVANGLDRLLAADSLSVRASVPGTPDTLLELTATTTPIVQAVKKAALQNLLYLSALLAVFIFIASRAAAKLAAPLAELNALTTDMAANPDMQARFSSGGGDEVAQLGHNFNLMIDRLQARDRELAHYRSNLEEQVEERTRALRAAVDTANQANSAKSDFLARMSHEIRTPMNAIVGLGKLLLKTELSAGQRKQQEQVLSASDMLLGLINDILDYSRIEAGKLTVEDIEFALEPLLREVLDQLSLRAHERGLELLMNVAPEVPAHIRSDPLRLRQILVNLISNAIKFTERGEIIVSVRAGETLDDTQLLHFSVKDSGIGISADKLDQLFSPFTQVDGSITRRYGGSGLGLAISQQLVELMGGEIQVRSTLGEGSCFCFSIRCRSARSRLPLATPQDCRLRRSHALIIDDNHSARDILAAQLVRLGVQVDSAASGAQGLAMAHSARDAGRPYDVLLIDWLMPDMDGIETVRQLNASPLADKATAILMTTTGSETELNRLSSEVGLQHLLTKPVSTAALCDILCSPLDSCRRTPSACSLEPGSSKQPVQQSYDFTPIAGARVLLVDDVALNRSVALAFLEETGVLVDTASNGLEALACIEAEDYDLVLMDIQMPHMDGLSATRILRRQYPALPVLAMTAHAMQGDREASLAAGMNEHLVKPIDPDLLYRALLKWIPARPLIPAAPVAAPDPAQSGTTDALLAQLTELDSAAGLAHCMQRTALYLRLLENFVAEFSDNAAAIASALQDGERNEARRLAHSLKSAAATLGAQALSTQARTIEQRLASGAEVSTEDLNRLAATLERLCLQLRPVLAASTARPGSSDDDTAADKDSPGLAALLDALETQLRNDDARALTGLAHLLDASPPEQRSQFEQLRDLVEDVEYERALVELDKLRQQLLLLPQDNDSSSSGLYPAHR